MDGGRGRVKWMGIGVGLNMEVVGYGRGGWG